MLLSESVSKEYLVYLKELNISYVVTGKNFIDLKDAMNLLNTDFNIQNIGVVGGGNINAAFLDCNLLDEVSVLIGPAIDGRKGMTSLFDGLDEDRTPFKLKLDNVKTYSNGCVWLRYHLEEDK